MLRLSSLTSLRSLSTNAHPYKPIFSLAATNIRPSPLPPPTVTHSYLKTISKSPSPQNDPSGLSDGTTFTTGDYGYHNVNTMYSMFHAYNSNAIAAGLNTGSAPSPPPVPPSSNLPLTTLSHHYATHLSTLPSPPPQTVAIATKFFADHATTLQLDPELFKSTLKSFEDSLQPSPLSHGFTKAHKKDLVEHLDALFYSQMHAHASSEHAKSLATYDTLLKEHVDREEMAHVKYKEWMGEVDEFNRTCDRRERRRGVREEFRKERLALIDKRDGEGFFARGYSKLSGKYDEIEGMRREDVGIVRPDIGVQKITVGGRRVWKPPYEVMKKMPTGGEVGVSEKPAMPVTVELKAPVVAEFDLKRFGPVLEELYPVLGELFEGYLRHLEQDHNSSITAFKSAVSSSDMTSPWQWFPKARLTKRKIVYHGGPTNSGKTYQALQRLAGAESGLYLGPLRLLALEVYEELTAGGVYCNLMTGQEKREVPFATHSSCTIEMTPLDREYEVVVIDEIQMIGDDERGHAWTKALMGVQAKEIHVCGGLEAENLVRDFAALCGDEFELQTYGRFNKLVCSDVPLNPRSNYATVRPGDCVVAFNRNDIYAIRKEIEELTPYKCCVVYGNLPPETRASQAKMFNDPDSGYDILVASDAIGMGLNLNIRRVVFHSIYKSNGRQVVRLDHSSMKQIAGRAGRRSSPFKFGEVTTRTAEDLVHIKSALGKEIEPIPKAGLLPTVEHVESFAVALEEQEGRSIVLSEIVDKFAKLAKVEGDFFLCRQGSIGKVAEKVDDLEMPLADKYLFCVAPVNQNDHFGMLMLRQFAEAVQDGRPMGFHLHINSAPIESVEQIGKMCGKHNVLDLFLWLSMRFPGNHVEVQGALKQKEMLIYIINETLRQTGKKSVLTVRHDYSAQDEKMRRAYRRTLEGGERERGGGGIEEVKWSEEGEGELEISRNAWNNHTNSWNMQKGVGGDPRNSEASRDGAGRFKGGGTFRGHTNEVLNPQYVSGGRGGGGGTSAWGKREFERKAGQGSRTGEKRRASSS